MVAVLLILDGASEPLGAESTSLERAHTPVLDGLVGGGALARLQTVPPGLPAGSDTAIPALLGWTPSCTVDRGSLEAAAREIVPSAGHRAWRIDVVDDHGDRAEEIAVVEAEGRLRVELSGYDVRRIGAHRLLVIGAPPLRLAARRGLRIWSEGALPPRILTADTVVVAACGAAAGTARLMGATVVIPDGATGLLDTDLGAKAEAALGAIAAGARLVVVHIGAPDEASHQRDPVAKIAAIERIDSELLPALAAAVDSAGGTLKVCPDHGCDPSTGLHCPDPVPQLTWTAGAPRRAGRLRLSERAVADLPVVCLGGQAAA